MAATQISPQQRRFAGQIAWERDLKITSWPTTPKAVSALIQRMIREVAPVPVADWQLDAINERLEKAAVDVENFDAAAVFAKAELSEGEMPSDRSQANKMLRELDQQLGAAEFAAITSSALENFTAPRGSDQAKVALTASVEQAGDEVPF